MEPFAVSVAVRWYTGEDVTSVGGAAAAVAATVTAKSVGAVPGAKVTVALPSLLVAVPPVAGVTRFEFDGLVVAGGARAQVGDDDADGGGAPAGVGALAVALVDVVDVAPVLVTPAEPEPLLHCEVPANASVEVALLLGVAVVAPVDPAPLVVAVAPAEDVVTPALEIVPDGPVVPVVEVGSETVPGDPTPASALPTMVVVWSGGAELDTVC